MCFVLCFFDLDVLVCVLLDEVLSVLVFRFERFLELCLPEVPKDFLPDDFLLSVSLDENNLEIRSEWSLVVVPLDFPFDLEVLPRV